MKTTFDFKQFDADSHVQESGGSWECYLDEAFSARRPQVVNRPLVIGKEDRDKAWYIDGRLVPKFEGSGAVVMSTPCDMAFAKKKPVPVDIQSCLDPMARAAEMTRLGISRSVLFSTLFLEVLTEDLVYETALMHAWNQWMVDCCARTQGALTFAALIPFRDPMRAIKELQYAKAQGAATVMLLPTAGQRFLHDSLFDPFWAEAQALQMPVSIHIGWPNPQITASCDSPATVFLGAFDTSMWWAYLSVFAGGIFDRFPRLKISFVEHDCRFFTLFMDRAMHWHPTAACREWPAKHSPLHYLKEHDVYFCYEGDYGYLPSFMSFVGDDRVMGAFDYPHTHYGVANLSAAFDFIREHEALSVDQKKKILHDNAASFYGWKD